ncbi:MAG: ATP-binding protein [Candidatus Parabeggiatoa sp.]|nr:ATP-binding protein [Candidatus Parabeggiatoa sp.]
MQLFLFHNRIELINPGQLPNHLTTAQIRYGLSNIRNPVLASHASHILPYRGLGTGIPIVYQSYADIELINDCEGNQFKEVPKKYPKRQFKPVCLISLILCGSAALREPTVCYIRFVCIEYPCGIIYFFDIPKVIIKRP